MPVPLMYSQVHNELAEIPFSTMPDTTPMLGIENSGSDAVPTVVFPVTKSLVKQISHFFWKY